MSLPAFHDNAAESGGVTELRRGLGGISILDQFERNPSGAKARNLFGAIYGTTKVVP
jgi:hypothetical protein